ncbi:MAG TPA: DNA translocase FtsK 4TM domain-containing protein, partial [Phycisphaerae bacterium]|nr:DNA translocase FtsK 4TM domain-containing protein [Phycisphaerae bacterium]
MSTMHDRGQVVRGCVILLSLIVCAFLWVATLSFNPLDWPSPQGYPHPDPASNAAGRAGAWVAYHAFVYLGRGAYAALAGATIAIGVLIRQGRLPSLWQRVIGIGLLIAVTSTAAHLLTASGPVLWPEMRGGVLGFFLATWLQNSVKWMTVPVLGYALLVGVLFTVEGLVLRIPKVIREHREQLQSLADEVRQRVPKPSWLSCVLGPIARVMSLLPVGRPVLAGEGAGAGGGDIRINPGRPGQATENRRKENTDTEPDKAEAGATAVAEGEDRLTGTVWENEEDEYDEEDEEDEEEFDEGDDESADAEEASSPEPASPPPPMVVKFAQPTRPAEPALPVPIKPYPTELSHWEFPGIELLEDPEYTFSSQQEAQVREKARILEQTLADYRIEANVVEIDTGPVITMFEVAVAPGVKVSQISSLANDIARALKAPSVRVVAPIPGKNTIGIEVPNLDKEKVRLKELMTLSAAAAQGMALPLFLGKDANGNSLVADLTKAPHMLIAGTTGSGKSVCINSIIMSVLMTQRPDLVKLILVDPKMVEMSMFRDVPHLMCPIVNEMERAEKILEWATVKMDERYALLAEAGVRNIAAYNRLNRGERRERFQPSTLEEEAQIPQHLPYIVVIIDELADLMMLSAKEVELYLSRLAQKSRAVGIHI